MRWGVLGGSSRIFHKSLLPAFHEAWQQIVDAPSREGDSTTAYETMLRRDDIDAVYIPLPNHLHAEWAHRALDAGKHVLCEKPLTLSVADTESLFHHAEAVERTILEAYMWPHHPRAQRLVQLVRSGEVGWPQWGSAQFSWPMDMSSGDHRLDVRGAGALFDVGIYCIAPFMMMARRDPSEVAANAVRNMAGVDVSMTGWLDWGGGFGSTFHTSFEAPNARRMMMATSEAEITLPGAHTPGSAEASDIMIERRDGTVEHVLCAGANAYAEMVLHFAAVATGGAEPVFGRTESVRLARILQQLHQVSVH